MDFNPPPEVDQIWIKVDVVESTGSVVQLIADITISSSHEIWHLDETAKKDVRYCAEPVNVQTVRSLSMAASLVSGSSVCIGLGGTSQRLWHCRLLTIV